MISARPWASIGSAAGGGSTGKIISKKLWRPRSKGRAANAPAWNPQVGFVIHSFIYSVFGIQFHLFVHSVVVIRSFLHSFFIILSLSLCHSLSPCNSLSLYNSLNLCNSLSLCNSFSLRHLFFHSFILFHKAPNLIMGL